MDRDTCLRCLGKLLPGDPRTACGGCGAAYHHGCLAPEPCVSPTCAARLAPERRAALAVVLPALFAALTYVLGWLQVLKLNMEAKTLAIFAAGLIAGPLSGGLTGLLATVLHQVFNPLGALDLFGCAAQAAGWALAGVAGGLALRGRPGPVAAGLTGAALTLAYHLLTDLAGGFVSGVGFWAYFIGGCVPFPFTPIHIATNAALFALLVPPLIPTAMRWREKLRG